MSILIGVGVITTVSVFYLGRKGWYAFHKAVGITPGVLIYHDKNAPLALANINWQQLNLNKRYLKSLTDSQLRQLHRIDEKVASYHAYQAELKLNEKTPAITEQQFVLHKMLHTRLPEMLSNYYQLMTMHLVAKNSNTKAEAGKLLQDVLDNIEQRLDSLLEQMQKQQLQDLRAMKNYIDSHHK
ncbi:hypothetical protein [Psychrobacter glacincola]|uniref:5-bromo-4-chloroindolyl phosphate hydrolysis protein n=1 Tax=Psychrobacter glacincola TaxID=56810 RepID=A0ABW1WBF9_9GAMM|nr:hypothetical protein [Psychrobacter glacincola]